MPVCSWRNTRSTQACVTDQSPRTLHNMLQTRAGVIVYVTKYSRSRFLDCFLVRLVAKRYTL